MRKPTLPSLTHFLGGRLELTLTRASLSLALRRTAWGGPVSLVELPLAGTFHPDALAPTLAAGRLAGLPLSVTLGDDLVRLFMVAPPGNARGLGDIRAVAALRFQRLYGEDIAAWRLTFDAAVDQPFLACAMPQALHAALLDLARTHRLALTAVTPRFVTAWNAEHRRLDGAWLGVAQERGITLGCVDVPPGRGATGLMAVHRLALPPGVDARWLRDQLRTVALRHGLADPVAVKLIGRPPAGLAAPTAGTPTLSWQVPAARPTAAQAFSYLFGWGQRAG
ncbi:hypothetical protein [Nitrospirillum viridazoti]|uniref:Uncharacterized protein n=1 Tax=Nitrospirillum viridazoti CBAmc TaxID=1441467 RepID=A0A248K389_9PROT|nr:hypothetical protein [Nitrospirillum amazonense]ASG25226.1 hypothetical protein Y958_30220 [Nitrospirillum amazonense CBAmc]TWB35298.1 hypothetical protein FBZ91_11017 [Nitrospirillum amazonense]